MSSYNHSTNHTKTWDKIVENIMKFIGPARSSPVEADKNLRCRAGGPRRETRTAEAYREDGRVAKEVQS